LATVNRILCALPALLLALILALALAACGSQTSADSGTRTGFSKDPAAQTVEVRVDMSGKLAWERTEYAATAGDVTFVVSSPPGLAHNFVIEGNGIKAQSKSFSGGTTNRFTLKELAPGTYKLACTLPGHREGGMVASLVVR
jgi:uncharacterized cupredoxin-like copper-binding protein